MHNAHVDLNPIKLYSALFVNYTAYCTAKIVSAHWCEGSAWAERVWQGEAGMVTHRVTCTWWLLVWRSQTQALISGKEWLLGLWSRCMTNDSGDCWMLVNEWAWSKLRVLFTVLSRVKAPIPVQVPTPTQAPPPLPNFDSSLAFEVLHVVTHHAKFLWSEPKVCWIHIHSCDHSDIRSRHLDIWQQSFAHICL